jgi:hypothetical protein
MAEIAPAFRRSCRLQPVAPRSSALGFYNTLHEGNEIFRTFGDRLFSLLTLEQLQSFLDSKAHLSHSGRARVDRPRRFQRFARKLAWWHEAWLFRSEPLITPMSKDNLMDRYMKPALRKAGLGWVNFLVMQRTYSSLMNDSGVDPKVVADLMSQGC